ncbi:hypothetical protein [Streptomyces sp. NPDC001652]|uniref:hypothetical protein n=1 Tax=Streptomyces sp. NPDC001652 TaxID=3154393 RepID=UPI003325F3F5
MRVGGASALGAVHSQRRETGHGGGSGPEGRKRRCLFAAVLEDIAENGLPAVEDCTPWEELREQHLARLAKQRPAVA